MFARAFAVVSSACLVAGCTKDAAPPPQAEVHAAKPVEKAAPVKKEQLTFLITGSENGYLLATPPEGPDAKTRGGAAETLGRWVATEGHCAGPLGADGAPACADGNTVVLSTGDNANGQAISSYFKGASTAELMRHMGFAASAFGNRELDWARPQFIENAKAGGFPYLAANLEATDDEAKKLGLQPFRLLTRRGVKVAVVGLASHKATVTPMPGRMAGLTWKKDEAALSEAIPAARAAGAQVVAVVSDGCLDEVTAPLEAHPDWAVAFVAGRKCEAPFPDAVGMTRLVYPGRHFNAYAKVVVTLDVTKADAPALLSVDGSTVEVVVEGAPPSEPAAAKLVEGWKKKLDEALGGDIGFTATGFEQESPEMSAWLATALKERFSADVGLVNRKGVRQALAPGHLTKATAYDLIPFDNQIVVAKVSGEALLAALGNINARVAGVKPKGDAFVDGKGALVSAKKTYTVAMPDYLYLGGDGFALHQADAAPKQTGVSWQAALIEWTAAKKSSEKKPLETFIRRK